MPRSPRTKISGYRLKDHELARLDRIANYLKDSGKHPKASRTDAIRVSALLAEKNLKKLPDLY